MPSDKLIRAEKILNAIRALPTDREIRLMEVCGTHTMAIAKAGIKSMLPENVKLLSGPGCPVCVTPTQVIDAILELSMESSVTICSYGDLLRVPGSRPGDNLNRRKALGADVRVVYSPVDAVDYAAENPDRQVVFLGAGFETTAPGTAAAVLTAKERGAGNFTVWSMLKTVEPALRRLMELEGFNIQGFICPGHVGTIIGERGFEFLPRDFGMPAAIAGFEPDEILLAIYSLLNQIEKAEPCVDNCYKRAVSREGNNLAMSCLMSCFELREDMWRGLGTIPASGLGFKDEYSEFDAERRFKITYGGEKTSACRCGQVITGMIAPTDCPMFGGRCTPEDPVGPCMVSSEGACAAAYKYQVI